MGSRFEILDALPEAPGGECGRGRGLGVGKHDVWNVSLGNRACGRYA